MKYFIPSTPEYYLWYTFRATHETLGAVRRSELRRHKISPAESAVLFVTNEAKDGITPAEISRQLFKDPNSISPLLIRMEKKGLLENNKGFPQKHMIQVKLTKKGREAFKLSQSGRKLKRIMDVLSKEEKIQFEKCLDKLRNEALEELS